VRPPAHEEHREDSRPGEHEIVASPGETRHHEATPAHEQARPHQGVPRPAERGGAEFVERGAVGPVEATGRPAGRPVSEQVGGRAVGPQPAARPDAQIVGIPGRTDVESAGHVQPGGPAANTGEAGSRLIETDAWSVQRALTEEVNLLAFDRLSNALDSLPARMVEMGLVVARVAGFISGDRPAGGTGERGPPQGPSSPASNLPGNALSGAGSPGGGFEPLPAVLALILVAAALRRRYWPTYEHRCEAEAGSPTNTRAARLILLALGMLRVPGRRWIVLVPF
jgi:hypothetical protein